MKRNEFIDKYRKKTYLGDGLYVSFDGYHFILSTERDNTIHWIGLEPSVFDMLIAMRKQVYKDADAIEPDKEENIK